MHTTPNIVGTGGEDAAATRRREACLTRAIQCNASAAGACLEARERRPAIQPSRMRMRMKTTTNQTNKMKGIVYEHEK